jgi:hypothetical protein
MKKLAAGAVHALVITAFLFAARPAFGQTDEIQVYDGSMAEPGKFNLTLHNNYTPDGVTLPAFAGALVADRSLNGVPEWAYGVTRWFEAGLYLPLYSVGTIDGTRSAVLNGFKLRLLFAVPEADDRRLFYGVNFEFSYNARHWDATRVTSEVRPIIGWHLRPVDIVLNPIFDTSYDGVSNLTFVPATRVAYHLPHSWAVALEEYDNFGPLHRFYPASQQTHQLYGVIDRTTKFMDIEAGIGIGLTDASDKLTLKLILSRDLN